MNFRQILYILFFIGVLLAIFGGTITMYQARGLAALTLAGVATSLTAAVTIIISSPDD